MRALFGARRLAIDAPFCKLKFAFRAPLYETMDTFLPRFAYLILFCEVCFGKSIKRGKGLPEAARAFIMDRMGSDSNKEQLHIAMIGHKHVPSREGGVEVVVWELARRLRERGFRVDCYNRNGYHMSRKDYDTVPGLPGGYRDGIRILTIPTVKNGKLNAIVYSVFATVRAVFGHYDVIHFHAEGPCLMLWLPKLCGIPVVATIHGLDWDRAKWGNFASRMLKRGEAIAAKHADAVIVLSRSVQDYFLKTYGRETQLIPNGISRPMKRAPRRIVEKFGLQGGDYIMTLSRIVPEKGIHYLLEAYAGIESDKKLVIVGGYSYAKDYMDEIHTLAKKDPRVILTGWESGEELEELMSNPYLFVLPSDLEGMSVSLLEEMSYGQCCLVSDIPENTDVVGEHAPTFHRGDADDLRKKLRELLEHPDQVQRYRDGAADYICGRYSWDRMTDETVKVYREAISKKKR